MLEQVRIKLSEQPYCVPIIDKSNESVPDIPSAASTVSADAVKVPPAIGKAPLAIVTAVNAIGPSPGPLGAEPQGNEFTVHLSICADTLRGYAGSPSSIGTLTSDDTKCTDGFVQVEVPSPRKRKFVE